MVAATDNKLAPEALVGNVLAFDQDGEERFQRDVALEVTDRDQGGGVEIAFDLPERLPKGARVYLRFDLPAMLRRVLEEPKA